MARLLRPLNIKVKIEYSRLRLNYRATARRQCCTRACDGQRSAMDGTERERDVIDPRSDGEYYPPFSDNRYKGLIYWWTFGELRGDPEQLARYISQW